MSLAVRRIGHATFETLDISRMTEYYVHVIGLSLSGSEKSRAFLSTPTGLPAVTLVQGSVARCTGLSFQIDPGTELGDAAKELSAEFNVASSRRSDSHPSMGDVLSFADSNGTEIDVFTACSLAAEDRAAKAILPLKLGHIAFKTTELEAAVRFYQDVLGFRVSDWRGDFFVWMRCGPDHHTTNFVRGDQTKMHHVAFELKDAAEILRACDHLGRNNYKLIYGPGRHLIGDNIFTYHRNPDGQIVELFTELARMDSEAVGSFAPRPWHVDNPYVPKVWDAATQGNLWGLGAPPGFGDG